MKNNSQKKVLFIAYYFPPSGGGGVQRSSKFVKYLPSLGWIPLVLTVKEPFDYYVDQSLMKDIPGEAMVYRSASIEPMKWVRKLLKMISGRKLSKNDTRPLPAKSIKPGILVTLKTWLLVPDNEILWLPFAVWKGWRIIHREQPALIFSTASPFTDHLIAALLSRLSGLPWVSDFRDFWVDRANFPQNRWRLFIDRKLEKWVLHRASHVITATSLIARRFKEINPQQKYTIITNGYDEADFESCQQVKRSGEIFLITYAGIFNREQNPAKFLLAYKQFLEAHREHRERIRLRLIGQLDNPGDFENYRFLKQLDIDDNVEIVSYLPHEQVIREMCAATVLMLLIGEYPHNEAVMTGKIFEYLRAGRPILAVVPPDGVAAEVIRQTHSGVVVSNNNVENILQGISLLHDLFLQGALDKKFKRSHITGYERRNLTKQLTEIFNKTITTDRND